MKNKPIKTTPKGKKTPVNPDTDKNSESEFPGYPHYKPAEDIYNNVHKEELETDTLQRPNTSASNPPPVEETVNDLEETSEGDVENPSPSDVTPEEINLLDTDHLNADGGDDELLRNRVYPVDVSGSDLDIPGTELDDASEAIGEEDEENNPYSIGGDRHEDLEEDRP